MHDLGVKMVYGVFYLGLVTLATTGMLLAYEDDYALIKENRKAIKQVHNCCMYVFLGFIVLHLAGIVFTELKKEKGIVSDMINGGEE